MAKRQRAARSSAETGPESTAVALSRTSSSTTRTSASAGGVACLSRTPPENPSFEQEHADRALQAIGGVLSRQLINSDCVWLLLMDLKRLGFEREAELLATGFCANRTRKVQGFMG